MPVSGHSSAQTSEPNEPVCADCKHYEGDCICWLGEWCDVCHEFECWEHKGRHAEEAQSAG